jgi:hypothetical protein
MLRSTKVLRRAKDRFEWVMFGVRRVRGVLRADSLWRAFGGFAEYAGQRVYRRGRLVSIEAREPAYLGGADESNHGCSS